jgi:hypothetical protein
MKSSPNRNAKSLAEPITPSEIHVNSSHKIGLFLKLTRAATAIGLLAANCYAENLAMRIGR